MLDSTSVSIISQTVLKEVMASERTVSTLASTDQLLATVEQMTTKLVEIANKLSQPVQTTQTIPNNATYQQTNQDVPFHNKTSNVPVYPQPVVGSICQKCKVGTIIANRTPGKKAYCNAKCWL